MSSQGPASSNDGTITGYATGSANPRVGTVQPRGYRYFWESIRNASDYTEFIRQQKGKASYVGATTPKGMRPEIYGSWFRLQYLLGRHKRAVCGDSSGCVSQVAMQIRGEIGES